MNDLIPPEGFPYTPQRQRSFRPATVGAATLMVLVVMLQGCGKDAPVEKAETAKIVKFVTVGSGEAVEAREFPGKIEATRSADVAFRVAGPLIERPAKAGMGVKKGDLLAQIDPRDFQTRLATEIGSLDAALAKLAAMKAGARPEDYRALEAQLEAAEAQLHVAELDLGRFKKLLDEQVIPKSDYDQKKAAYDVAKSEGQAAAEALKVGKLGARKEDIAAQEAKVKGLEATKREAANALSDTELRAPFDGIVARTFVDNFEEVQAKQTILRLQDISQLDVVVHLSEADMAKGTVKINVQEFAESVKAVVTIAGFPERRFPATLRKYETEADPETQTFKITLTMAQPDDVTIRPGMNAVVKSARSRRAEDDEGHLIPARAVFSDPSGVKSVWVVDPDTQRTARRSVTADEMAGDRIRVTDGLEAGETICATAAGLLREGMKVKPMPDLGEL